MALLFSLYLSQIFCEPLRDSCESWVSGAAGFSVPFFLAFGLPLKRMDYLSSNLLKRITLFTPPKPAEMERAILTSLFLASFGT